jgi:predicted nucleotidyltransferase
MSIEGRLTKKLYDPRDVEGSQDVETFEAVRMLEKALSEYPEFIGLDPFGSTMKGYSTPDSDIDIEILIDVGVDDIVDNIRTVTRITSEIEVKARSVANSLKGELHKDIHTSIFIVNKNENSKRIQYELAGDEDDALIVGNLFRIVRGPKIQEYRKSAIENMLRLNVSAQQRAITRMATALNEKESRNLYKAEDRSGKTLDALNISQQRISMWEKRIRSFIESES